MDAEQRKAWQQRLALAHGAWLCPCCKTAYASQAQFAEMAGVAELTRHSGCGHVIMWRAGGADWLDPYVAEPMQAVAEPVAPVRRRPRSKRVPIEPYVLPPAVLPRGQRRWVVPQPPPALKELP